MGDRRTPPEWDTGDPYKKGIYLGFADHPDRTDRVDIYSWDGKLWQHHLGMYDHLVSHWILIQETD